MAEAMRLCARLRSQVTIVVLLAAISAGCVSAQQFKPGMATSEKFAHDDAECRALSSQASDQADRQAERFENADGASLAGAALMAMFAGGQQGNRVYNNCMKSKGYRP